MSICGSTHECVDKENVVMNKKRKIIKRAQLKAARERQVFIYHAGVLTENGSPVK